jgi:peptidase E
MPDRRKPVFLLAGGRAFRERKQPDPLIQRVFGESGVRNPTVAYIGAASGDDERFFSFITRTLMEAGAGKIIHAVLASPNADVKQARKIINAADAVYISGGDVEKGMQVLREKGAIDFLTELYKNGKLFFGLSAGSIMLAQEWVRWRDPDDDSTAELFHCLGFAPVLCDMHAEEDGWPELKAALMFKPEGSVGYGIVGGAGLIVYPDGRVEASGDAVHRFFRNKDGVERMPDLEPGD